MMMSQRPSLNWFTIWHLKNIDRCQEPIAYHTPNVITITNPQAHSSSADILAVVLLATLEILCVWLFLTLCLNFEEVGREKILLENIYAYNILFKTMPRLLITISSVGSSMLVSLESSNKKFNEGGLLFHLNKGGHLMET